MSKNPSPTSPSDCRIVLPEGVPQWFGHPKVGVQQHVSYLVLWASTKRPDDPDLIAMLEALHEKVSEEDS